MEPDRWKQVDNLLQSVLERPPGEREEFLLSACAGDEALEREVRSLLTSEQKAANFLESPAIELEAQALAREQSKAGAAEAIAAAQPAPDDTSPTPNAAQSDPFIGRTLSHYRLDALLGAGGMGVVYRATDLQLGRAVAIKLLSRRLVTSEGAKARFLREARAASALDHPNIGAIYDVVEESGELFIVMALYEGETLKQRLERGALPASEVTNVLRHLASGLQAAHGAGVVHRDIKPANAVVTSTGTLKILDFGLAKLVQDSAPETITQAGDALGTLLYMSPEQLRGETVDHRTDLWSLGVVAYELLAGAPPFRAESNAATAARILRDEPPSLATLPGVPGWLAELIGQLLRKDPAERLQSASDVTHRLDQAASGTARPRQKSRRLLAAVGLGCLAVLGLAYVFFGRRASPPQDVDRSVAVLPFANLSSMKEDEFFADGIHSELTTQLAKVPGLRVIARGSVQQYREGARDLKAIAEALSVGSLLEGSVQRIGSRVRIAAQLVDPRTGRELWAERFDREISDAFAIQTEVALEIASALNARLSASQKAQIARRPTESAEAYDLYLRGLEYANRSGYQPDNFAFAERLYQRAIQTDPSFALARARLAYARIQTYWSVAGTPDSVAEEARKEAEQALQLQPDLAEAHLAMGAYYYWGRRDYDRASQEFEIARPALPAEAINLIGFIARRQGRFDDAIRNQQQAVHLDPRSPWLLRHLAVTFILTRRYDEADRVLDRALAIAPEYVDASMTKAWLHEAWKGETNLAQAVLREARGRLQPRGPWGVQDFWIFELLEHNPREALPLLDSLQSDSIIGGAAVIPKAFFYAVAYDALGDPARARKEYEVARSVLEASVDKHTGRTLAIALVTERTLLARCYAGLGRKDDALREARRAVEILPISKDTLLGPGVEIDRAAVEARVGETDAAIEHIRQLLSISCRLSPALLRIDPKWAPLRGDPRFRQLAGLGRE